MQARAKLEPQRQWISAEEVAKNLTELYHLLQNSDPAPEEYRDVTVSKAGAANEATDVTIILRY